MFYDRKIKYLDYYENGERIKGSGFVKLEVREGVLRIDVTVTGLHPTDSFDRDILLCGEKEEKAVGKIVISQGRGHYLQECRDLDDLGGIGLGYGELRGIRIPIGTGREITGSWQKAQGTGKGKTSGNHNEIRIAQQEVDDGQNGGKAWKKSNGENEPGNVLQNSLNGERESRGALRDSLNDRRNSRDGMADSRYDKMERRDGVWDVQVDGWGDSGIGQNSPRDEMEIKGDKQVVYDDERRSRSGIQENLPSEEKKIGDSPKESRKEVVRAWNVGETIEQADSPGSITLTENLENGGEGRESMGRSEEREVDRSKIERSRADRSGVDRSKTERNRADRSGKTTPRQPVKLMEDKWSQLWAIYPHVRPFRDGREYLSIGPGDFVLFSADAYKMVNNSFLLHGYYNYNHLILTRIEKKGEILYYIGAPGNYYEREKQVAIMFGFESFECAEEPAQTGDFGYYMMRTQL